jgi:hypothetical protein
MTGSIVDPTPARRFAVPGRALPFVLALAVWGGAVAAPAILQPAFAQAEPAPQAAGACLDEPGEPDPAPFARTELFFGTAKPDGTAVTLGEWRGFLDREITPRFPDGLTVMTGLGQWQEEDETIVQERSMQVILLYPREFARESGEEIEEIRAAYEEAFEQESVLRSDDAVPVCASF